MGHSLIRTDAPRTESLHSRKSNHCATQQNNKKYGTGDQKYKSFNALVKSALALSHGNAVLQRGFSVNNSLLSSERLGLSEKTIIADRVVKEAVGFIGVSQLFQ